VLDLDPEMCVGIGIGVDLEEGQRPEVGVYPSRDVARLGLDEEEGTQPPDDRRHRGHQVDERDQRA
jgi:hypothetical protein